MIPLSIPHLGGREKKNVLECLDTNWISSAGRFVEDFEKAVADYAGCKYAVATVNGTASLHMAMVVSGIGYHDVVIVPAVSFVATANAVVYVDAEPVFIDVSEDNWQLDLDLLETYLQEHTVVRRGKCLRKHDGKQVKAIIPVHILGYMGNMPRLCDIAGKYNLLVIEDAAEAMGTRDHGRHAGTFGHAGCLSFNGNKIMSCGGGGMLITDSEETAAHAKHISTQAKKDKALYWHDETGYNYRLVNILAAIGLAQLEQLDGFIARKKEIFSRYKDALEPMGYGFPEFPERQTPNYWLNTVICPDKEGLERYLSGKDIETRGLWAALPGLPMFSGMEYFRNQDVAGCLHRTALSLPSSSSLGDEDLSCVVDAIAAFHRH